MAFFINEADNIDELITQLLALPVNLGVIVVDDNSPDGTGKKADRKDEQDMAAKLEAAEKEARVKEQKRQAAMVDSIAS